MRQVNRIIIHWLGPGSSFNYVSQGSVDGIRNYHMNVNGWSDIGYHWLIDRNGKLYPGRPEDIVGAHAYGANTGSIGICVLYGTEDKILTAETIKTLTETIKALCEKYDISPSGTTIIGHKDVMATECPGIVYSYIPSIISSITGRIVGSEPVPMANPPETKEIGRVSINYKGKVYEGVMINNQSYIAIGTLARLFNLKVTWDGSAKKVTIG